MASAILGLMKLHSNKLAQVYYLRCTKEECVVSYFDACDPRVKGLIERYDESMEIHVDDHYETKEREHVYARDILNAFKKQNECTNQIRTEVFNKNQSEYYYYAEFLRKFHMNKYFN